MHITGLKMFDMFIDPPGRPATLKGRFSSSSNRPVGLNFATKNRPSEGRGGAVRGSCGSISRSTRGIKSCILCALALNPMFPTSM
jgi:hypothetical protein